MIEINVEFPQREVIQATAEVNEEKTFTSNITLNAKPEITGVTASVDNNTGTPSVDVTSTGTGTEYSFDLAFHNLKGDKGDTGATGANGQNGQDGVSPTATVTQSGSLTTISITDKNGTTSENIDLSNYALSSSLATVATSGSYADLSNKPTIPTTASDINAADTDLSNLSSTGQAVISGQWVQSTQTIIESTSLNNSSGTGLQKTVTLPDDGCVYEVLMSGRVQTDTTSGNNLSLTVKSNVITDNYPYICSAITRTSSYMGARGNIILPMKYGTNNLTIGRASSYNGTAWLYVLAYRRLGTNS